jgi:CRISPR/Cas system CSM-associated protein Csm3 (group 7 of RAMP superfamily)
MNASMKFAIHFRGPFHVARGQATMGLDRTVDLRNPLPASSLKGLMRAEATLRLGLPSAAVDEVFGAKGTPSPWAWSDADLEEAVPTRTARIKLAPAGDGAAEKGFLMFGEHVWASSASFEVNYTGHGLSDDQLSTHQLILCATARSVSALGGGRRRGEGWVRIEPVGQHALWGAADTDRLMAMRGNS